MPAYTEPDERLSVSSNGSNGLRRDLWPEYRRVVAAFSILERIEWAATQVSELVDDIANVSVSSNGSNGLRRRLAHRPKAVGFCFSILERIEWAATRLLPLAWCCGTTVSVSSNGSNGLRRIPLPVPYHSPSTVSVSSNGSNGLRRASARRAMAVMNVVSVSSNGSNGLRPAMYSKCWCYSTPFQYPRTDRMGCDIAGASGWARGKISFSILERIEWAATR